MLIHSILILLAILLLATPALAAAAPPAPEPKPLAELDALRLERMDADLRALTAEVQARQERIARIQEQAQRYVADLARQGKTEGCQLDLPKRQWLCPKKAPDTLGEKKEEKQ